jgi:hypothetical protein
MRGIIVCLSIRNSLSSNEFRNHSNSLADSYTWRSHVIAYILFCSYISIESRTLTYVIVIHVTAKVPVIPRHLTIHSPSFRLRPTTYICIWIPSCDLIHWLLIVGFIYLQCIYEDFIELYSGMSWSQENGEHSNVSTNVGLPRIILPQESAKA